MYYTYLSATPCGRLLLAGTDNALSLIAFEKGEQPDLTGWQQREAPLRQAMKQLDEYFDDKRQAFDLPLAVQGTIFQLSVWGALAAIPYGETRTYGEIATAIGNPKAVRAVGQANHRNRLPVVIPCHRVVGKGGDPVGFAGGLALQQTMLDHECRN